MGWDGMRWDEMGWGGMAWHSMAGHRMAWNRMAWNSTTPGSTRHARRPAIPRLAAAHRPVETCLCWDHCKSVASNRCSPSIFLPQLCQSQCHPAQRNSPLAVVKKLASACPFERRWQAPAMSAQKVSAPALQHPRSRGMSTASVRGRPRSLASQPPASGFSRGLAQQ